MLSFSYRKVGGIVFVKIGRIQFSFCRTATYKPIKGTPAYTRFLATAD